MTEDQYSGQKLIKYETHDRNQGKLGKRKGSYIKRWYDAPNGRRYVDRTAYEYAINHGHDWAGIIV